MDIDAEKPRVLNDGGNDGELDLNEEIRVSNDDLGEMKDGVDEIRVTNDGVKNGDDLDLNEEVRVLNDGDLDETKNEIEEIRVSSGKGGEGGNVGGYYENGDSAEVDGESVVKDENSELRNGENEVKKLESSSIIGRETLQDVEMGENDADVDKPENYESSRSGNSVLMIADDFGGQGGSDTKPMEGIEGDFKLESRKDFGGEGESDTKPMDVTDGDFKLEKRKDFGGECKSDTKPMEGKDGDLKLERRKDFGAPQSRRYLGIDIEGSVMKSLSAKVSGTEFEIGDMVWGKVKSHPWWPGHLYNDAFASSSVRRSKRDGHILIAFFGDSSYGWFYPDELIPYDPNYADKYQQITSRNFVRAVEESIDEASRRSALGLSCYCRNPNNFRPTDVPGYLTVDFDPGSVYSVRQIQKARESFRPKETLSFIHQLGTAPNGSDSKNLDVVKNMAIALAYRRSVFEEFDETYAEAFGHKPERPALPQTSVGKEPFRAPLSGPLVFADTRGAKKSYTKSTKLKEQSKKDKYLFKRRDESNDLKTATTTQDHDSPSSSAYDDGTSNSAAAGYVFQKRDQTAFSNDPSESPGSGVILTSVPQSSIPDEVTTADSVDVRTSSDNVTPGGNLLLKKKKTAAKRPASELSSEKPEPQEKKVKKLKKAGKFKSSEHLERPSAVFSVNSVCRTQLELKKDGEATDSIPHRVGSTTMPTDWDPEVSVHQMLSDLLGLALNPSHCMERNGPDIPRQFFLKFRSLYFVKSYSESEHGETQSHRSLGPESTDKPLPESSSKTVTSLKKPKVSVKPDDPTKVSRKRVPSERQEENAAKKAKKITDVKSLAEKRAQLKKNPGSAQSSDGKPTQNFQSKPVKKVERPQKVEEPTYLVMKFQEGSSLPSLMELKARFTRFGPLDTSLNRVFYKTYTCRVAFLYKQDANVAYRYAVGSKSLFPNVRFMLRPVAGPESQQPTISKTETEPGFDPALSTIDPGPAILPPPYSQPLKSILKKPGGDESGGPSNGGGNSRTPRVRFNVGDEKSIGGGNRGGGGGVKMMEFRNSGLSSNEGASLISSSSSSSNVVDVNKNQRLLPPLPLQPPLLPLPRFPPRPPINPHFNMYPNNNFHENLTTTTSTACVSGASYVLPPQPPPPPPAPPCVDISQQLMSLLTRCNDVVTNVKSVLGYVPYHSL